MARAVKNLPANAGDTRASDSVPGLGIYPGEGSGSPLSILAWKIPQAEKPGRLLCMGL